MEHISHEDLLVRFHELLSLCTTLTPDGKIGATNFDNDIGSAFTETLYEFRLRFGPFPNGFIENPREHFKFPPHIDKPIASKLAQKVHNLNLAKNNNDFFYKFGDIKLLKDSFEKGFFRILPATGYADPSLSQAQYDDELACTLELNPKHMKITTMDGVEIKPTNCQYTYNASSNYYVFCIADSFSPRMVKDFDANACIIIKDRDRFTSNMVNAFNKTAPGISKFTAFSKVKYYDPLRAIKNIDVFNYKHFKYYYQDESRLYWITDTPKDFHLNPIYIDIGNMSEYAEFITE